MAQAHGLGLLSRHASTRLALPHRASPTCPDRIRPTLSLPSLRLLAETAYTDHVTLLPLGYKPSLAQYPQTTQKTASPCRPRSDTINAHPTMLSLPNLLTLALTACLAVAAPTLDKRAYPNPGLVKGDITGLHDPGIAKGPDGYVLIGTGQGLPIKTSKDRIVRVSSCRAFMTSPRPRGASTQPGLAEPRWRTRVAPK